MPTDPLRRVCCFTTKHAFHPSVIQLSRLLSSNQTIFAYLMIILNEPMYNNGTCTYTVIYYFTQCSDYELFFKHVLYLMLEDKVD